MTASMDTFEMSRTSFYIDGAWRRPSSAEPFELFEAATGELLGNVPVATESDIDAAVHAARRAFDEGTWSRSVDMRVAALRRFADELQIRRDVTGNLVSRENGMPSMMSALSNTDVPVMLLHQYAGLLEQRSDEVRKSIMGATMIRKAPIGVVAAIVPWNFPQFMAMAKIAPALAAGNTVVLKPSPETALDSYILADAAEAAGIPPGVLNIVPAGREVSAYLVAHPGIDKVAFTGSTAAGRSIGEICGGLLRPVTLELGGKSAAIILEDADLDLYAAHLVPTSFVNNGQTCVTHSRILAPATRYQEVLDAVVSVAESLTVGNPLDPAVMCGPMVSSAHRDRVLGHIDRAVADGATIATGGGIPRGLPGGWFVSPTVFSGVDNASALAQEEVFGPVIAVISYDTEEDAVRLANASIYGLAGSVWTADEGHGIDIARRIGTGTIGVNYYQVDMGAPFGGYKASGLGREFGPEGLDAYTQYQSIYVSADHLDD